jgi:hypothetical protein
MYVGILTTLLGESVFFGSLALLVWTAAVAVTVHLFVVLY